MAHFTVCDACEDAPRMEGEVHRFTPAAWHVRARAKSSTSADVRTTHEADACQHHLGDTVELMAVGTPDDFYDIVVDRL